MYVVNENFIDVVFVYKFNRQCIVIIVLMQKYPVNLIGVKLDFYNSLKITKNLPIRGPLLLTLL
jgi:hypothetical protein